MTEYRDLLLEIGTEELPPKALRHLSEALGEGVRAGLHKLHLGFDDIKVYATPRRLAVLVLRLAGIQPHTVEERRGPALTAAFDGQGNPTPAALGFARSCGIDINALETQEGDKGAWLLYRREQQGRHVRELLPELVRQQVAVLPVPKRMRWSDLEETFVRPVHWIVLLYGEEVLPLRLFGLDAGRATRGHRFLRPGQINLSEPAAYAPLLETEGRVIADFSVRREAVRAQVMEAAVAANAEAVIDESLLDEVTAMVEWPVAVRGGFERRFLEVPSEALISAMKAHQKYFHLVDGHGRLMPAFITVSNIDSPAMDIVRAGNERVIRPRLSDAMFFWEQDRRHTLESRLPGLQQVIFQRKLGTLRQKSERVAALAANVAQMLGGDVRSAERAGHLSKCDLMTQMVGEFPELQGVMGGHYARHDGEPDEVVLALQEQYLPRFSGDRLPVTGTGRALSVADKLDTLVGIFGIGQSPTGDKDPFALRRAAIGVLRILIEGGLPLDLVRLLDAATAIYKSHGQALGHERAVADQIYGFMMDRLRAYYLETGMNIEAFEAVLARRPAQPLDFDARVKAVARFQAMPEAVSLAAANKRIGNILRKAEEDIPDDISESLLSEPAEKALADAMKACERSVGPLAERADYSGVLRHLAEMRGVVDAYFDQVLVMSEDALVRRNRLAQLSRLRGLFMQVADLSCLFNQA
ncbi:MAG: glycine--tRNA ligase subunit beta [Gammaproteobacteria bacterium]|nr:glycine--tRNA ligase subunit beta [Gammaproteobacteria bacterium]